MILFCHPEPVEGLMKHEILLYILECSDKSYYVGMTNDLERRLIQHKNGSGKFNYTSI
jgi:putative endonuclease